MSQATDTLHAKDLLPQPDESGIEVSPYAGPAGGWGALASTARSMQRAGLARSAITLKDANQAEGFDCPGCAWPDAPEGKLTISRSKQITIENWSRPKKKPKG